MDGRKEDESNLNRPSSKTRKRLKMGICWQEQTLSVSKVCCFVFMGPSFANGSCNNIIVFWFALDLFHKQSTKTTLPEHKVHRL